MKIHPAAELFPMMSDAELQSLAQDIKANGLREPIRRWHGQIIDGRNRRAACGMAGVEATFRDMDQDLADDAAVARYVASLNLERRHLSTSLRAMIGAKLKPLFEPQRGRPPINGANLPHLPTKARDEAAKVVNVSPKMIDAAVKVEKQAVPEIKAMVERDEVSVSAAAHVAKLPEEKQQEIAAKGPAAVKLAANSERVKPRQRSKPHQTRNILDFETHLHAIEKLSRDSFSEFRITDLRISIKRALEAWAKIKEKLG